MIRLNLSLLLLIMNKKKKLIFFLIFILLSNCSFDNKTGVWSGVEKEKRRISELKKEQKQIIDVVDIYLSESIYSKEISVLYDHLLENNNFEEELRNLLIYKKALFNSDFVNESELLETIKPLLKKDTLWKPHGLLLLGDYFVSKGENIKAIEFYQQILSINNLHKNLYDQAKSQLVIIAYE